MAGWRRHEGLAVALPLESVDTDQVIPARFMAAPRSEGYGRFLLHDLRRDDAGRLRDGFPLNAAPEASILVAGRNFGAGSSREAAVYALVDAGFRAVIAPSFGDIFAANAVNNGLLPARVEAEAAARLADALATPARLAIDLEATSIAGAGEEVGFEIDPVWRLKLVNGWDDIDLTAEEAPAIAAFSARDRGLRPWARPTG